MFAKRPIAVDWAVPKKIYQHGKTDPDTAEGNIILLCDHIILYCCCTFLLFAYYKRGKRKVEICI